MNLIIWSNVCMLYGSWIQWLFVASATSKDGHYRMDIISCMGNLRLDLVVTLVLCTVACNGWGTGIVLQVSQESANPIENG
jgi:hypothetical protein